MNAAGFRMRLDPFALPRLLEVRLEQREVDADKRRHAETLMLEFVVAARLRLAVVVDEDEAIVGDQFQQSFERLDRPIAQEKSLAHRRA